MPPWPATRPACLPVHRARAGARQAGRTARARRRSQCVLRDAVARNPWRHCRRPRGRGRRHRALRPFAERVDRVNVNRLVRVDTDRSDRSGRLPVPAPPPGPSRARSDRCQSTSSTSSWKDVSRSHPSTPRARAASPSRCSTSSGRNYAGSMRTNSRQSKPTWRRHVRRTPAGCESRR